MRRRLERCHIELRSQAEDPPPIDLPRLRQIVEAALAADGMKACLINVLVVDATESARLHRQHFDDDAATDVMTFPDGSWDPEHERRLLGDIAVCADVAREVAAERGGDADARDRLAGEELTLYILHGLLHLLGYDDQDPRDRAEMWQRQRELLAEVGIPLDETDDPEDP